MGTIQVFNPQEATLADITVEKAVNVNWTNQNFKQKSERIFDRFI